MVAPSWGSPVVHVAVVELGHIEAHVQRPEFAERVCELGPDLPESPVLGVLYSSSALESSACGCGWASWAKTLPVVRPNIMAAEHSPIRITLNCWFLIFAFNVPPPDLFLVKNDFTAGIRSLRPIGPMPRWEGRRVSE